MRPELQKLELPLCPSCQSPVWVTPDTPGRTAVYGLARTGALPERQKRVYSGKQKRHTLKTQVATDQDGAILTLEAGHRGPQADSKLYEEAPLPEPIADKPRRGDKGSQSQEPPELTTPHKKPRGGRVDGGAESRE